ncbi:ATP-dependent Clp protease, protease subunit [Monoraphidium neglectum]|uniref:ATP-dependent Clp protease, protease subunit n=1 Tax=Monoraphidium neglectum TaxID=145388 RepID=A0A0D2LE72_9CHLO|nr:ATP-dependent Clp protease, protease subunit [Monoraphidium neglectum]KIZ04994.1 ATP-dependent Clp protease, protease subunit [Monoraphidium neglectum]|eukprot:XP_013904013.1 ATP-dependent Clp protease, protease subunit [Monoraphidium neglectum]
MPIDSSVAELITAQLFVLSQEAPDPIFFYINSTGIAKSTTKYGNEHEAIAVYSMMRAVQKFCPIYTLCGKRAALRSTTIMIRQPLQRLSGMQASDIDIYRRVTREKTGLMAKYLAASTGKTEEEITSDFQRPRYFNPFEAVGYGLIDQVLEPKDGRSVGKDWEELGSEIGNLPLLADDEQPLPTNVMYPGTSEFWRNDDYEE